MIAAGLVWLFALGHWRIHATGRELPAAPPVPELMKRVTAIDHLIGELLAMCVLAYTPGGMELEDAVSGKSDGRRFPLDGQQAELTSAHVGAKLWGELAGVSPEPRADAVVSTPASDSGAAIGHARRRLKEVLAWAYRLHAAGAVLATEQRLSEGTKSQGPPVMLAALQIEQAVAAEWQVLDALEEVARKKLLPLKWLCNHTLIPALCQHCKLVVERTPFEAGNPMRTFV